MVDDDDLMGAGVGLDEGAGEVGYELGGFVTCADDDADGVLLGMLFCCRCKKGKAPEEPTIIE